MSLKRSRLSKIFTFPELLVPPPHLNFSRLILSSSGKLDKTTLSQTATVYFIKSLQKMNILTLALESYQYAVDTKPLYHVNNNDLVHYVLVNIGLFLFDEHASYHY